MEGWRMVKSETRRDAETFIWKSETETWKLKQNPSPSLCAKKTEPETSFAKIRARGPFLEAPGNYRAR